MSNKPRNRKRARSVEEELDPVRAAIADVVAGGVVEPLHPVDLPKLGVTVHLRKIDRTEALRLGAYAMAGDEDDFGGKGIIGVIRFSLVDDLGKYLLGTMDAAAKFLRNLDDEDFAALLEATDDLNNREGDEDDEDDPDGEGDDEPELDVVEVGKER